MFTLQIRYTVVQEIGWVFDVYKRDDKSSEDSMLCSRDSLVQTDGGKR